MLRLINGQEEYFCLFEKLEYNENAFECIYTYDNIPPSAIEIVEEIEQQYLNNKR